MVYSKICCKLGYFIPFLSYLWGGLKLYVHLILLSLNNGDGYKK